MFYIGSMWFLVRGEATLARRTLIKSNGSLLVIVITVLLYGIVIGLRDNVGGDYQGYVTYYISLTNHMTSKDVPYELGFYSLIRILRSFDFPPAALFVATSTMQMFFISLWLRRHPFLAYWYIYFFFTCLLLFESMNTIRQALAYSLLLAAMPLLLERRFMGFASMVLFASLFHFSAMLFIPLYFLLDRDWILSPRWQIATLLLTYLTAEILKDYLFDLLPLIAIGTGYDGYSDASELLFFQGEAQGLSAGLIFIMLIDILVMKASPMLKKRFSAHGFRIYYNLYTIGALFTPVVLYANYIPFQRLAFYFTAFKPVVLAFLIYAWLNTEKGRYRLAMKVAALAVVSCYFLWFSHAIDNKAAWSAPFQFVGQ
jgi:transmembrane protein EpsG